MKRLIEVLKGLGSIATIFALVCVVPWFAVPYTSDRVDFIRDVFTDGLASQSSQIEASLTALLMAVLWVGWAMIVLSLLVEITNQVRGRAAPSLPVFPGIQVVARRLVATATLVFASFSMVSPAIAAASMPTPAPATVELNDFGKQFAAPQSFAAETPEMPEIGAPVEEATDAGSASTVVVERGETWWSLAESHLGDGMRWQEIRDANLGRTMNDGATVNAGTEFVGAGWEVVIPDGTNTTAASSLATPTSNAAGETTEWVVDDGEHFWVTAKEALVEGWGREPTEAEIRSHWIDVQAANSNLISSGDVDLIFPGEELVMPAVPADPLASDSVNDPTAESEAESASIEDTITDAKDMSGPSIDEQVGGAIGGGVSEAESAGLMPLEPVEGPAPTTVPPTPTTVPTTTPVETPATQEQTGEQQALLDLGLNASTAAVGFGAAGVLLATYKVARLERGRRKRMFKRKHGETPAPVDGELAELDQEVRQDVNDDLVGFFGAAWRSLATRHIPEPDQAAQPVVALRDGNTLQVLMSSDDTRAPAPWTCPATSGDEAIWSLPVDEDTYDLLGTEGEGSLPLMVALGENMFVNAEASGPIGLSGDSSRMGGLVRSMMLEATSAPWADGIDVRVTEAAATQLGLSRGGEPVETIARSIETIASRMLETLDLHNLGSIYAARSVMEGEAHPTLIVCDKSDEAALETVLGIVSERRASLGLVMLNDNSTIYHGVLDETGGLIFGPSKLRCRSAFAAADLAEMFDRLEHQRSALVPPPLTMPEPVVNGLPAPLTVPDTVAGLVAEPELDPQAGVEAAPATPPPVPDAPIEVPDYIQKSIDALAAKRTQASTPVPAETNGVVPDHVADLAPADIDEEPGDDAVVMDLRDQVDGGAGVVIPAASSALADESDQLSTVVVRVLGDVQVEGADDITLSNQELSVLTYLALEGDQNASAIKTALYGPNTDVKEGTFKAVITRFRKKVGKERFPEAADGRYRLVNVTTDFAEFSDLVSRARNSTDKTEALNYFLMASAKVLGQPFGPDAGIEAWGWIDSADNHPRCHMSARIGDALLEGSRLAMELSRHSDALEIIERGKVANPWGEELVCLHVEVLMRLDQRAAAEQIVTAFERRYEDEFQEERPSGPRMVLQELQVAS